MRLTSCSIWALVLRLRLSTLLQWLADVHGPSGVVVGIRASLESRRHYRMRAPELREIKVVFIHSNLVAAQHGRRIQGRQQKG